MAFTGGGIEANGVAQVDGPPIPLGTNLEYLQGYWVLTSHGVPQIHFRYEEVLKFLDRFAPQGPACKL